MPDIHRRPSGFPTRRGFLRAGVGTSLGLTLGPALSPVARAAQSTSPVRSVILLWLWGGPSHLETFDMKPRAPVEYRGPFEPIATNVPGIQICELLPQLARRADRFALLRAMHHESNDHGVAGTIALTGSIAGAVGLGGAANNQAMRPSIGSVIGRLCKRPAGELPPYVILGNPLHQGHKRVVGEGAGVLGATHDPLRLNYVPGVGLELPDAGLPEGVSAERFRGRWSLRESLDCADLPSGRLDRFYGLAHRMMASREGLTALDLAQEPEPVRASYGTHRFGQCCLIARRLVEKGVPFIQVNWSTNVEGPEDDGDGGWDMHDRYFEIMQDRHGWILDRALSALFDDLLHRGLLASTLVIAVGEFGRTPKINDRAGRDHWNNCYSALLAGGGVQGGRVIGASDARAEHPVDQPHTPADLGATMLERFGVTSADLTAVGVTPLGTPIAALF